jgi:16S rRNA G1207 methylase RsmC
MSMPEDTLQDRLDTIEALLTRHLQLDKEVVETQKHWHLKKEVTVAHILSTIGIVGIALASWFSLSAAVAAIDTRTENITESRIAIVESELQNSAEYMRDNFRSINGSLAAINSKLDILEERSVENRRE